jgi:hypothetical protein
MPWGANQVLPLPGGELAQDGDRDRHSPYPMLEAIAL